MAQQIINVGAAANDGTGDTLRLSQQKANLNFTELYGTKLDSVVAGTNVTIDNTDPLNPIISTTAAAGDMNKSVYDTDDDGIVDSAKKEVVQFINKSGATLTKGTIVYLKSSSSSSTYPEVLKANASTEATSSKTIGAVFEDVANDAVGLIVTSGEVRNLDTSAYVIGDKLWLSTTDGLVTTTAPTQPNHTVFIGTVTRAQNTNGRILYAIQNGYELNELHNVLITTPTNDQVLTWETSSSLWKNKTLTGGVVLTRQEFSYSGAQTFTLSATPSYIYAVFVNGQELNSSQYFFITTTLTISDTLQSGDKINIIYSETAGGVLDYYTKAQIDAFLTNANIESIIGQASSLNSGYLSFTDWLDFDAKQDAITLTTNNYSGVATFSAGTLNIPNYEGFIPKLRGHETFRGVNYSNNSTTEVTSGGITISTTGSTIARSVASTNFATKQIRKGFYGSVVSAGRYTGTRGSALLWYLQGGFKYVCDVYISDTAYGSGCRQFYGMMGQTSDLTYSDSVLVDTMINVIGVGSDALDTNLQVFHNDGSGTATKIDLGASFPANRTAGAALTTVYSIEIYNDNNSSEVKYCVINKETGAKAMGTISTNLPLNTQGLNFTASRCMGAGVTNTGQFDLLTLGVYSL